MYQKSSKISRLPAYLTIQYVRFFYGRSGQSEEQVSKKILKVCPTHSLFLLIDFLSLGCQVSSVTRHV